MEISLWDVLPKYGRVLLIRPVFILYVQEWSSSKLTVMTTLAYAPNTVVKKSSCSSFLLLEIFILGSVEF
jgi:hypothetical protein